MEYFGRNDANIKVIVPVDEPIAENFTATSSRNTLLRKILPGDFIVAQITESNSQVLKGLPLYHTTITQHSRALRAHGKL